MMKMFAAVVLAALALQVKGGVMSHRASGTFEVKMEPVASESRFPRLKGDKQFHGDLEGTSQSEMMHVSGTVEGSGGYVAIEIVSGSLQGRKCSFALVHSGTMKRGGEFNMIIRVVPDSGTEQLAGLTGTLEIIIQGDKHFYNFDYDLPDSR